VALMDSLSGWLRQVIAVVLLASLVDLLLPNRTMQRYVRLVAGLFILLTIATPMLQWLKGDFGSKLSEGLDSAERTPMNTKAELSQIQDEGVKLKNRQDEQAADLGTSKLSASIREEVERTEHVDVRQVEVNAERQADGGWNIQSVTVTLEPRPQEGELRSPVGEIEPIAQVDVRIDVDRWPEESPSATTPADAEVHADPGDAGLQLRISSMIAGRYGIPSDAVEVVRAVGVRESN
jgi:stage III sporulation protein AF